MTGTIGAMRRSFNQLVIEIDPELDPDELLFTLLHEIAHANLHPDTVQTSASPVFGNAVQAFPNTGDRRIFATIKEWSHSTKAISA